MQEYWVVGGIYRDVSFLTLTEGSTELFGPFLSYGEALERWREKATTTRYQALTRYSLLVTADDQAKAA